MNDELTLKLEAMKEGGKLLAEVRDRLVEMVKPGVRLEDIEVEAMKLLKATGGEAAFVKVPDYFWATCINVNEGIVHGIPNDYAIKAGDVVSIDVGLFYKGFYTDTSTSLIAPGVEKAKWQDFLEFGRLALKAGIAQAKLGNRVGHISEAIEKVLQEHGLRAVPSLTGHGVGKELHERPYVPGILGTPIEKTQKLYEGQTLAIEVIYTPGSGEIKTEKDGWTISTKDDTISGLYEETVAVLSDGPLVLTKH